MSDSAFKIEVVNARIISAKLTCEDGAMMFSIACQLPRGWSQVYTSPVLDEYDDRTKDRIGTAFGMELVRKMMTVAGVDEWGKLVGSHVRLKAAHNQIHDVGHILEEIWLNPKSN